MIDKTNILLEAKQQAILNNGFCLSDKCIGATEKLKWKCSNPLHPCWFSTFDSVMNNNLWCLNCINDKNLEKRKVDKVAVANSYDSFDSQYRL